MTRWATNPGTLWTRRDVGRALGGWALGGLSARWLAAEENSDWRPHYVLASSMYGQLPLAEILPEVRKTGAREIDLWPPVHGDQRKAIDELGPDAFAELLDRFDVGLAGTTRFDLGPFDLAEEIGVLERLGGHTIVTAYFPGAAVPRGVAGEAARVAVGQFVERMKPTAARAAEAGVTVAIENHSNGLICSPDSIRYLADLAPEAGLGLALAPYHLPQEPELLATLVEHAGDKLALFYAWQYGQGCMREMPKEEELQQMPGRGPLDFAPVMAALRKIRFTGPFEIFMHPVPRGIPILPTIAETTAEINRARNYLETLL